MRQDLVGVQTLQTLQTPERRKSENKVFREVFSDLQRAQSASLQGVGELILLQRVMIAAGIGGVVVGLVVLAVGLIFF